MPTRLLWRVDRGVTVFMGRDRIRSGWSQNVWVSGGMLRWQRFGGVAVCCIRGRWVKVDGCGVRIVDLCAGKSIEGGQIVDELFREFEVDRQRLEWDVEEYLMRLWMWGAVTLEREEGKVERHEGRSRVTG